MSNSILTTLISLHCSFINPLIIKHIICSLARGVYMANKDNTSLISNIRWDTQCLLASILQPFGIFLAVLSTDYTHEIAQVFFCCFIFCFFVLRFIQVLQPWSEAIRIRDQPPHYHSSLTSTQHAPHSCSSQKADQFTTQTYHAVSQSELSFPAVFSYENPCILQGLYHNPLLCKFPKSPQPAHYLHLYLAFILFCLIV